MKNICLTRTFLKYLCIFSSLLIIIMQNISCLLIKVFVIDFLFSISVNIKAKCYSLQPFYLDNKSICFLIFGRFFISVTCKKNLSPFVSLQVGIFENFFLLLKIFFLSKITIYKMWSIYLWTGWFCYFLLGQGGKWTTA